MDCSCSNWNFSCYSFNLQIHKDFGKYDVLGFVYELQDLWR